MTPSAKINSLIAENFTLFTFKGIETNINSRGEEKKKPLGMPVWKQINQDNFKDYIDIKNDTGVAIITGKMSGISVIDFDDVQEYDKLVVDYPEIKNHRTIKTKNGYHIYCQYTDKLSSTTNGLTTYNKVDIRNDDSIIFAPPTTYKLKDGSIATYEDLGGDLLPVPEIILKDAKVNQEPKTVVATKPTISNKMEEPKPPVSINMDKMLDLGSIIKMEHLNSYHDWLKIVWALRSESEQYKEVAREISKRSKGKYEDEGFEKAWNDYKPGCVSLGTFHHYCKTSNEKKYQAIIQKHTPKPEIKVPDGRDYESVKARFEQNHLLISNKSLFIRETEKDNIVMSRTQFITSNERVSYDVVVKDQVQTKCFVSDWLKDDTNRMKYDMTVYPPGCVCPDTAFNLWRPFAMERVSEWKPNKEAISMVKKHIKIMSGNEQVVADYLELWIAQMIQFPAVKSTCPTLISDEGAGKGTLIRLFERMLGSEKILQTTKPSQYVWGNFNGPMKNAFLVNMDELSKKEGEGADGFIKGLITEPKIWINEKGIIPYEIESYHRFFITTNNEDPVKTSKKDRRKLIVRASDELIGNRDYFNKMYAMLDDNDAVRSIYEYFKTLPGADKFKDVPMPETEYHRDIKEAQSSPVELWLRQFVMDNFNLAYVELSSNDIYQSFNSYKMDSGTQFECSLVSFSLKLKNQKVDGVGEVLHTKTGNKRRFDIPKMKAHFKMGCLL
jgi:hypothetical protein